MSTSRTVTRRFLVSALSCASLLALSACRAGPWDARRAPCDPPVVSRVMAGDTLHGHLHADQGCQCFHFDGVEYAVIDLEIKSDVGNQSAPQIAIYAPDDAPVPLPESFGPAGSGCQRGGGIVLPKTGTYRVTVCKAACEPENYYSFRYDLAVLSPGEQRMHLTAAKPQSMTFVAPRGSRCMISVRPDAGCTGFVPRIKAVKDPMGAPALDEATRPENFGPATLNRGTDGSITLDFAAPRSGRYVLDVSAEEGGEGDATTYVSVIPPQRACRDLYHDNRACPEKMVTPLSPSVPVPQPAEPTSNR